MTWETVIGLEVHAQLKTCSKLFSSSATRYGAPANSQTSYIDAGLPGILPVLNQKAVQMAIQFGFAINATINNDSFFERKNYFYPDLPKGYQISQFQRPIVSDGHLDIDDHQQTKRVEILRAHLEEDAGKSLHEAHPTDTGIDLNRAGNPLLEIVTTPCITSAKEAICYLKTLHQLLVFLDICDGNMQEGSFRCDVNISIRPKGQNTLGTRTELKNLNSFRFIEKAIHYEECRHQDLLESGQIVLQETRLYCPKTNTTQVLRTKENENDYRYFPDPDLLPIHITAEDFAYLKKTLPALPSDIKKRLDDEDGLPKDDIDFLLTSRALIHYYDEVRQQSHASTKTIVNWLKGTYKALLHERGHTFDAPPVSSADLACILNRVTDNAIPTQLAKIIFTQLANNGGGSIDALITASGYQQQNNATLLEDIIRDLIEAHPQQTAEYRAGKDKLLIFFVGKVMKQTKGQGDPAQINDLLRTYLREK